MTGDIRAIVVEENSASVRCSTVQVAKMAAEERAKSEFTNILASIDRKYEIIEVKWTEEKFFETKFRTQIQRNSEDFNALCDEWVDLFSEVTNTVWAKKISNTGPKIRFRKQYQCWTHGGKVVQKELLFDARRCKGTLDIKVLTDNPFTRRKNKHIRLGLNVVVKINFIHLHHVDTSKPFAFFVHLCEPQPEAPKPVIQRNDRLPQLVAEMVQKGLNASPKVVNPNPPEQQKIVETHKEHSQTQLYQTEIRHLQFVFVIFASSLWTRVSGVEQNQPEVFLSPRHFNPHPYEAGYDFRESNNANSLGPVVFPPSPSDEDDSVNGNVVTIARERQLNHRTDDHPYAEVARKRKHKFKGRFNQQNNGINPRVYEALSNHAAKVLSEPASQLRKDYTLSSLSSQKKNYEFSYKVVDQLSGDDFSHTQSQNAQNTNGEYRVRLPDGRVQIVSYIADKNGYKADVKYTENELSAPNIQTQHQIRTIPIPTSNSYASPKSLLFAPEKNHHLYTLPPTSQPDIYNVHNYVGLLDAAKTYPEDDVVSTVSPVLEGYTGVYINAPKFSFAANQQDTGLVYGE